MAQLSLGLVETIGLAAAVEAADAAVKSANVALVGYELAKGDGMTVIKIQGEVGAVTAAVAAAAAAAAKINRVVSTRVIARPATGLERLVANRDTVGVTPPPPPVPTVTPVQVMAKPATKPAAELVPPEVAEPVPAPAAEAVPSASADPAPSADAVGTPSVAQQAPGSALPAEPPVPAAAPQQTRAAEPAPPPQSRPGRTGGRTPAGNTGKPRNRHDA